MLELNRIYNMDCIEGMKLLDSESIDLVVTSPPYDNLRSYNNSSEWSFEIFKEVAKGLHRILKVGGGVVWVVGDATIDGSETGSSFKQALYFKELGFNIHDTMIWRKSNPFNFGSNNCYIQSFEYMFIFSKGKPKSINLIEDRRNVDHGKKIISQERKGDWMRYDKSKQNYVTKEFGRRHNVWDIPTDSGEGLHPAVFPDKLAQDHITSWSNKGDLVLDPFVGSGTTALASIDLDRNFIGFEIDPTYFELANGRISDSKAQIRFDLGV